MAKGKKDKGDKGGGKKGKEEPKEPDPNAVTEVDKTFYELQIADLNRKLARLKTLTEELEVKNEELQTNLKTLDEDRSDVITYLKRTMQEKADEITDLENRLQALQETREQENEDFRSIIADMQQEYKMMQEQLSSEIKLLNGKLNSLEEYRVQRDDLMTKYEVQEKAMAEQELRHKREIYEIEKKFIIGKDRLKKEMEEKLLQLSCDFQDATNLRIAATTHRVIRENIAINNELDVILSTHDRLQTENESLKDRDRMLRMEAELHDAEKNKALAKSAVQYQLISKMTTEHEKLMQRLEHYKGVEKRLTDAQMRISETERLTSHYQMKCKILEQNLHMSRCDRVSLRTDVSYAQGEADRLTEILVHAVMCIKAALNIDPSTDEAVQAASRDNLLQTLLEILGKVYEPQPRKPSLSSVESFTAMYKKGDLGFVPVAVELRSRFPTKRNVTTEIGQSLEDMAAAFSEVGIVEKKEEMGGEEESEEESEEVTESGQEMAVSLEDESQIVFDDEPEALSVSSAKGVEINLLDLVGEAPGGVAAHGGETDFDEGEMADEEIVAEATENQEEHHEGTEEGGSQEAPPEGDEQGGTQEAPPEGAEEANEDTGTQAAPQEETHEGGET